MLAKSRFYDKFLVMTANELRQKYLEFFKSKGHAIIPSASLIPENDPTVLFTTAGMHPLVPYLMGEKHPAGQRLVNAQKCIRTSDIDEAGDNRHLTFFEMLGNWSLGDPKKPDGIGAGYFKKEAIEWSWEFMTGKEWLNMDPQRLYVSVFAGDEKAEQDKESIKIWQEQFAKAGMAAKVCKFDSPVYGTVDARIFLMPAKDNWWGPAGETGPCGPCTELFYDTEPQLGTLQKIFDEEVASGRLMEIWNDVFMEYNRKIKNQKSKIKITSQNLKIGEVQAEEIKYEYEKLAQKNVDTGMGVERTISVLNGKKDAFDNELFYPLFAKIEELSGKKYGSYNAPQPPLKLRGGEDLNPSQPPLKKGGEEKGDLQKEGEIPPNLLLQKGEETIRAMRIIADHIKAATFILGDEKGLTPSNVGAGYVLRRLIRRAVRYGKQIGINQIFTFKIAEEVVKIYQDTYAELRKNKEFIINQLVNEEEKFLKTLEKGLVVLGRRLEAQIGVKGQPYTPHEVRLIHGPDNIQMWDDVPHIITGKWLFDFYQTLGFPPELVIEELKTKDYYFSQKDIDNLFSEFNKELKKHQELSRTASAGMFKGGLADASEATVKYHTAAHLMLAALRQVLGEHVTQKGSNITPERLRFDFSHLAKMTPEEIKKVEDLVNEQIQKNLPVVCEEIDLEEVKAKGATGVFGSKYGERVKVYTVGPSTHSTSSGQVRLGSAFSREICGGPHVERTGVLGKFKIKKEESSSAGVRRIKAILE